jgi:hypothetical protein
MRFRTLSICLILLAACTHGTVAPAVTAARQDGWLDLPSGKTHFIAEGQGTPCLAYGIANYQPQLFSPKLKERIRFYFVDMPHWTEADDPSTASHGTAKMNLYGSATSPFVRRVALLRPS